MSKVYTINTGNKEQFLSEYAFISGSRITGSLLGTASFAQSSSGAISSSFAVTSSYVLPTGLPAGVVSSSTQINTGSFSGSFTGQVIGTASWAQSSSVSVSSSFATTASFTPVGPGTTNRIALFNSSNTVSSSVIAQSGETIGIGTTTTVEKLTISSGSILLDNNYAIRMRDTANTVETVLGITTANNISIASPTVGGSLQYSIRSNSGVHQFLANGAEVARISNSGNMGVGTPGPSARLHVSASGTTNDLLIGDSTTPKLFVSASGDVGIGTTSTNAKFRVLGSGVNAAGVYIGATTDNYFDAQNNVFRLSNQSETMRINSSGNVGINNTSPQARFHVNDSASATSAQILVTNDGTRTGIRFGSSSLGAGTQATIYHRTDTNLVDWILVTSPGSTAFWNFGPEDNSANAIRLSVPRTPGGTARIYSSTTHSFSIGANNVTDIIWVTGSGNVGIGTTSPGNNRLQVQGNISASSYTSSISNAIGFLGTSSWAQSSSVSISSSFATTSSYVLPSGLPSGVISSSTQQVVSTYTNATDNRVITSTGAGGINAESTLTYDGTVLAISTNNAKYLQGGDDAALWDVNLANTLGVYGVQDTTVGAIKLGSSGPTIYGSSSGFFGIGTTTPATTLHVQGNISASNVTASGDIVAGRNLVSNFSVNDEGGEINLARPQTNTGISGSMVIDVFQNRLRIYEKESPNRGGYWDITSLGAGVATNLAGGAGTVTQVNTGNGLSGGPITGTGTITLDTSSAHFTTGSITVLNTRGVVSSSTQFNSLTAPFTGSFTGSFFGTLTGTSSFATSASWAPSTIGPGTSRSLALFNTNNTLTGSNIIITGNSVLLTGSLGNLAIGKPSAGYELDVFGTLRLGSLNGVDSVIIGTNGLVGYFEIPGSTQDYSLQLGSNIRLYIKNTDGNVGIGTTSPANRLHVVGNVSASTYTSSINNAIGFVGTASWAQSSSVSVSSSFATTAAAANSITFTPATASYALSGSWLRNKAGNIANTAFTGNPRKAAVNFTTAFPNTNYAVVVTGDDSRAWSIEGKVAGGFTASANSNTALVGTTYWIATAYGET